MSDTETQLSRADLTTMSPAEIVKAQSDGLLADLLAGTPSTRPLHEAMKTWSSERIVKASKDPQFLRDLIAERDQQGTQ